MHQPLKLEALDCGAVLMESPKCLDLFCGAGGASMGLHLAGFDVRGVDIRPQPDYPFNFYQGDALQLPPELLAEFDFIWASPPCQAYSQATAPQRRRGKVYPDLIAATRSLLQRAGKPYVMENVLRAPLRKDFFLCGLMFDLKIIRHRIFEAHHVAIAPPLHPGHHTVKLIEKRGYGSIVGNGAGVGVCSIPFWQANTGMTWTRKRKSMAECVPVAYSRFIGEQVVAQLRGGVRA